MASQNPDFALPRTATLTPRHR